MQIPYQIKTLCAKPRSNVFAGSDKYLCLQEVTVDHAMFPVCEDDSLFIYVKSGQGSITINGVVFELKPKTLCWLQYYQVFSIEPKLGSTLELDILAYDYQLSSYLAYNEREITCTDLCLRVLPVIYMTDEVDAHIREQLDYFREISDDKDAGSALIKVSILGYLDLFFCRQCVQNEEEMTAEMPVGWSACIYIANQCTKQLEASHVAELFDVTPNELNHELKMCMGMNFSQMLNRGRAHVAMTAILFEGIPFNYIASSAGFKSEIVFFRTFKKLTGVTPQEYRDNITTGNPHIYRSMITNEASLSIINYIYRNFSEPISIKTMERDLYLSESAIRKLLIENVGMTYKDYLDMFRIRYAEALLVVTELPVVDISVAAGFNSVRTFMRVFQTWNNLSPSAYRKKYQRGGND